MSDVDPQKNFSNEEEEAGGSFVPRPIDDQPTPRRPHEEPTREETEETEEKE